MPSGTVSFRSVKIIKVEQKTKWSWGHVETSTQYDLTTIRYHKFFSEDLPVFSKFLKKLMLKVAYEERGDDPKTVELLLVLDKEWPDFVRRLISQNPKLRSREAELLVAGFY
jgi:hypothetical protein